MAVNDGTAAEDDDAEEEEREHGRTMRYRPKEYATTTIIITKQNHAEIRGKMAAVGGLCKEMKRKRARSTIHKLHLAALYHHPGLSTLFPYIAAHSSKKMGHGR